MLGRLLQYALLALAARRLDIAQFGDVTFALSAGYMLSQVADFGLQLYVQRELARLAVSSPNEPPHFKDEARAAALVGNGLLLKAVLSVVSLALQSGVVWLEPLHNKLPVMLVGLSVIGLSTLEYFANCFRALGHLKQEAAAYMIGRGLNLVLGAALLYLGLEIWGFALAALASAALAIAYSYRTLLRYIKPAWKLQQGMWRQAVGQQMAIGLGIVLSMAAFRIDNLLIPPLVTGDPSAALAGYNAAYKLFEVTLVVPGVLIAAVFPMLTRAATADAAGETRSAFTPLLGRFMGALFGLGVAAALVLGFGAGPLVTLLYSDRYAAAADLLRVLALGCVPMYASYGLTHALIAIDKPQHYAWATLAALGTNLAANLLLIPRIGTMGAAYATILTELVLVGLCGAAVLRHMGFGVRAKTEAIRASTERAA